MATFNKILFVIEGMNKDTPKIIPMPNMTKTVLSLNGEILYFL